MALPGELSNMMQSLVIDLALMAEAMPQSSPPKSMPWPQLAPSPTPPGPETVITWHLFERKYTGLANKDAGDFDGEVDFLFSSCFGKNMNLEASIESNIFEMSTVNVTGWGSYVPCNAPGTILPFFCPESNGDYCCGTFPGEFRPSSTTLPGKDALKNGKGGYWYSFPRVSEGVTWTEKIERRINGSCLANAWRANAGGCAECGQKLDYCVADCIQSALNHTQLRATWDMVFNDTSLCPDVPFPPPTPTPAPSPAPSDCPGGSMTACIGLCPVDAHYTACIQKCTANCPPGTELMV